MIIDVSNEIYTKLKTEIINCQVSLDNPPDTPVFPCLTFTEMSNTTNATSVDTSGEKHNIVTLEINIFTTGDTKLADMKRIRSEVDSIMSDYYGMNRSSSSAIPNYSDTNIYRYVLRYDFIIDMKKTIYRR